MQVRVITKNGNYINVNKVALKVVKKSNTVMSYVMVGIAVEQILELIGTGVMVYGGFNLLELLGLVEQGTVNQYILDVVQTVIKNGMVH